MVAIVKYNAGNIFSVQNALDRLQVNSVVTDDAHTLRAADKVIFPGVGEAATAMRYLREKELDKLIRSLEKPVLGICLGLQLMCNDSEEGETDCLGIFNATVRRFPATGIVPHMGWNNFSSMEGPLFQGLDKQMDVYYVHSYYADICTHTVATCDYIEPFSAAMQKDHFFATQFHPEKSAACGNKIIENFLSLPA